MIIVGLGHCYHGLIFEAALQHLEGLDCGSLTCILNISENGQAECSTYTQELIAAKQLQHHGKRGWRSKANQQLRCRNLRRAGGQGIHPSDS